MSLGSDVAPLITRRLELRALTAAFVDAVTAGELERSERELGAAVTRWMATDPSHLVQLGLAGQAAAAAGLPGSARVIVRRLPMGWRAIGSIGFHGPPDEVGRLEIGCRIHPTQRDRGYGAEAMTAMLDWATARLGITRFVVAVPSRCEPWDLVPVEIVNRPTGSVDLQVDDLTGLLETEWRRR